MSNVLPFPGPMAVSVNAPAKPADAGARARALDPQASFIVEAPAGSGKTGLLVQRFLRLLLDTELGAPEEVLAITFTKKATAELRERVLKELEKARKPLPQDASEFARETYGLAREVLARDAERRWGVVESPHRLNIRSIDSVCSAVANSVPVLSGSGGPRTVLPDARMLYRVAAHRTMLQLGGEDRGLHGAVREVLLHRDGNLADAEALLAGMLGAREQWGELVPLTAEELTDEFLDGTVRPKLEASLEAIVCAGLTEAKRALPPGVLEELAGLAYRWSELPGYKDEVSPIAICRELPQAPEARVEELGHWLTLIHLLLTKDGKARSGFNVNHLGVALSKDQKAELQEVIARVSDERVCEALHALRGLPPAQYPEEQWRVAKALFRVLRHALAELKLLFAERESCDFAELSLAARAALLAEPTLGDLALASGGRLRHLLVDEMQDTSSAQYDLLERLTQTWDGHTQTLFLVGDPKQSIYLFRQARVERFLRTMRDGRLGELPLEPLRLTANFRSQAELVQQFNETFDRLFPAPGDERLRSPLASDVPFVEAEATQPGTIPDALRWHLQVRGEDQTGAKEPLEALQQVEAQTIREVIERWRQKPLPDGREKPWRIAVLARNRSLLTTVSAELRAARIAYRAVEIDSLAERQEVLDCLALTRFLLHPADRIAGMAVLHAPWCGLGKADLLALTGEGETAKRDAMLSELVAERASLLSETGKALLRRAWPVLETALGKLGQTAFSTLAERTWRSLGGDAALAGDARSNAERFFALLREMEGENGGRVELPVLTARLADLYAEPSGGEDDVQLMTIHKAKGLEWDVVLVPALERKGGSDRHELLKWLELDSADTQAAHVLLAPISSKGEDRSDLSTWLGAVKTRRDVAESKRVFYVACTRAREELHLFATVERTGKGELSRPKSGSLLHACWPAAEPWAMEASQSQQNGADRADALEELLREPPAMLEERLALAASADGQQEVDLRGRAPVVHRLPLEFAPRARFTAATETRLAYMPAEELPRAPGFERPEGSFAARAFGNVVHRFLEELSRRLAYGAQPEMLLEELPGWEARLIAGLRNEGLAPGLAGSEGKRALLALSKALEDPVGRWILTANRLAASEASLTTAEGTSRADRMFLSGAKPLSDDETHLWIVDFKTTEQGSRSEDAFEQQEKAKYGGQMAAYASLWRQTLHKERAVCLGLYYPLAGRFLHWPADLSHLGPTLGLTSR